MLNQAYDAVRQLQSNFHKINTFHDFKAHLEAQNLKVFLYMRPVGYESVRWDLCNRTFLNIEKVSVEVTLNHNDSIILQDRLIVEAYPRECSYKDLEYIWTKALKQCLKLEKLV